MGQKHPGKKEDRKPTSSQSAKTSAFISSVSGDVGDDFAMLPAILGPGKKNVRFQQQLKAMQARLERYKNDMELLSKTHLSKDEFRMMRSLFTSFCKDCLNHTTEPVSINGKKPSNTPTKKTTKKSEDYSLFLTKEEFYKIFFPKLTDRFSLDMGNFDKSQQRVLKSFEDVYTEYEKITINSIFNATSDFNKRQYLTFHRFVLTISTMCRGTVEEKAEWCFGLYDHNREGYITKSKLVNLMRALKHVGILSVKNSKTSDIEQIVETFFEKAKSTQNDKTLFKKVEGSSNSNIEAGLDRLDLHSFVTISKEDPTFLNGLGIAETFFLPILRPIDQFVKCDNPYEFEGELYLTYSDIVDTDLCIAANVQDTDKFTKLHIEIRGGLLNGYKSTESDHFTIGHSNTDKRRVFSVDLRKIDAIENETQIVTMPFLKEIESQANVKSYSSDSSSSSSDSSDDEKKKYEKKLRVSKKVSHNRTSSFPSKPTNSMALSPSFSITLSKPIFKEMFEDLVINPILPIKENSDKKKQIDKTEKRKIVFISESSEIKMKWIFTILMYHLDHRKGAEGETCRFNSFAPERQKVRAKWYVDGKDAFQDIALALTLAKEEIFIADWCLHPTMYLLRGSGKEVADSRLDILLKKKASQGVKIYILLWNETSLAGLNLNTKKTKKYLKDIYPKNIYIKTHPKKYPVEWSHHQKLVVIDQSIGFLGGLDLCYGRWDDYKHNITDMNHSNLKYPGNDYQNPNYHPYYKYADKLDSFTDVIDREYHTRQAWHDIHCMLTGLAAKDCSNNFVERWNYAVNNSKENKKLKPLILKNPGKNPLLEYYDIKKKKNPLMMNPFNLNNLNEALQGNKTSDDEEETGSRAKDIITKLTDLDPRNRRRKYEDQDNKLAQIEQDLKEKVDEQFKGKVFEFSDTDQSDGEVISPVVNAIDHKSLFIDHHGSKIKKRLSHSKSKTLISVPTSNSTMNSKDKKIKKFQCSDEGFLCNAQLVRSLCKWSGSPRDEQSVYAAYLHLIDNAKHYIYIENQYFIGSTSDLPKNVIPEYIARKIVEKMKAKEVFRVIVVVPAHPEGDLTIPATQQIMKYTYNTIKNGPNSIYNFIKKHVPGTTDKDIENYLFFCTLRNYGFVNSDWRGSIEDTNVVKLGADAYVDIEEEEPSDDTFTTNSDHFRAIMMMKTTDTGKKAVQEHIYVHSKMMIVDDYITIIGSANINDRSMLGTRDSEIAVVIQDHPTSIINTKMNGKHYKSGRFAHSLRIRCWREHLGLLPSQNDQEDDDYDSDQPVGVNLPDVEHDADGDNEYDSEDDMKILNLKIGKYKGKRWKKWQKQREQNKTKKLIRNDPICDATFKDVWIRTARHNSQIYETVFPDTVISDKFKTMDSYLQSARWNSTNKQRDITDTTGEKKKDSKSKDNETKGPKKSKEEEIEIIEERAFHEESPSNDFKSRSMNFPSSKPLDSALTEKEKRKLLKQLKGNLCTFPLDFCSEETWSKPFHISVAVGDEIFV